MDLHVIRKNLHENYLALAALECLEDENLSDFKRILFQHRTDPNFVVERGLAPIHFACGMENLKKAEEAVELILKKNGNPNVPSGDNTDNVTPLHIAAMCGREKIVRMLLEHGGNIHIQDSQKLTPFQYAVYDCHFEVIDVIKKFVFEQKHFEENKKNRAIKDNNCEIANNNVMLPDRKIYTPNKTHYNFDVTSPYFINITHRRLKLKFPEESLNRFPDDMPDYETMNNDNSKSFLTSTMNDDFIERRNLFELTEENLQEMARNMMPVEKSRISLIKSWRDKVHRSRSRSSIIKKFKDIDSLLNVVTKNEEFDFTNSMLLDPSEKSPPKPFNSTGFGKLLNKLRTPKSKLDTSYETALTDLKDVEFSDSNVIRSPSGREYILQKAEQCVHTDVEHGIVFVEEKIPINPPLKDSTDIKDKKGRKKLDSTYSTVSTAITAPLDYDTESLRAELTQFGDVPGPITKSTKRIYIKRLFKHRRNPELLQHLLNKTGNKPTYSIELQRTINNLEHFRRIKDFFDLEVKMSAEFKSNQKLSSDKKWREGNLKQSFIYLLIDPRISNNLPLNNKFDQHEIWKQFLNSIFYVGKGKSIRPFSHLYQALKIFNRLGKEDDNMDCVEIIDPDENITANKNSKVSIQLNDKPYKGIIDNKKTKRILEIWKDESGVVCLHVFHNILPAEAYTREASIIDSLGLQHLTNLKRGDYYGVTSTWTMRERKYLGTALLFKAMQIFLAEGESQLFPFDLL